MVEDFTTVDENTYENITSGKDESEFSNHLVERIKKSLLAMEKSPSQQTIDKLFAYSSNFKSRL